MGRTNGFGLRPGVAAVAVLAGVMGLMACGAGTMHEGAMPPGDVIVVHVENHNFNDATIWTANGKRMRLGMVIGNRSETFRFRWTHSDLSLVVDFIGGGAFVTELLAVTAGDEIQLIIESGDHRFDQRPNGIGSAP